MCCADLQVLNNLDDRAVAGVELAGLIEGLAADAGRLNGEDQNQGRDLVSIGDLIVAKLGGTELAALAGYATSVLFEVSAPADGSPAAAGTDATADAVAHEVRPSVLLARAPHDINLLLGVEPKRPEHAAVSAIPYQISSTRRDSCVICSLCVCGLADVFGGQGPRQKGRQGGAPHPVSSNSVGLLKLGCRCNVPEAPASCPYTASVVPCQWLNRQLMRHHGSQH